MVVKLLAEAAAPDTICKLIGLCSQNVEKGGNYLLDFSITIFEPRHVISNNVVIDKCRLRRACAASC